METASDLQRVKDILRNLGFVYRCPTGAAKALLKVLDKAPEAALAALH